MKLAGICLITENVPALAAFYARVLGVQAEGDCTHAELKMEGAGIAIFSVKGMEDMAPHSAHGMGHGSITIMLEVQDVDREYERLQELGVEIVKPPASYSWGSRSVWFRDPDGNIVDFYAVLQK
jgi:uncharacterized glyoxalase superfamily protein PhnB